MDVQCFDFVWQQLFSRILERSLPVPAESLHSESVTYVFGMFGERRRRWEQQAGASRLCGAVRYTVDMEPDFVGVCHCRDCQRFTGSAYSFLMVVPQAALKIDGTTKTYASRHSHLHPD